MRGDTEKRRAASREAARRRRRAEADVFGRLCRLLPLQPCVRRRLDKPSIIRLTLGYIRAHALLKGSVHVWAGNAPEPDRDPARLCSLTGAERNASPVVRSGAPGEAQEEAQQEVQQEAQQEVQQEAQEEVQQEAQEEVQQEAQQEVQQEVHLFLTALEGFLMVLSLQGVVLFASDNVSQHVGLTQAELMGHNIFELTHPCDHEEIRANLRLTADEAWSRAERDFVTRMRAALTGRGGSASLKSAAWKVLHCRGRAKAGSGPPAAPCLLLTCRPLPLSHTLLSTHAFTSRHSMDLRFTGCDHRVTLLLGYRPEELLGGSIYRLCHPLDAPSLARSHLTLCVKTLALSTRYRILVKGGGYVWVETHSALIPSARPSRPLGVLCVTYVLSQVEAPWLQLSLDQHAHGSFG